MLVACSSFASQRKNFKGNNRSCVPGTKCARGTRSLVSVCVHLHVAAVGGDGALAPALGPHSRGETLTPHSTEPTILQTLKATPLCPPKSALPSPAQSANQMTISKALFCLVDVPGPVNRPAQQTGMTAMS